MGALPASLQALLEDRDVTARVKVEALLPVAWGLRPAASLLLPGDLPEGPDLVGAVDRAFAARYFGDPAGDALPGTRWAVRARHAVLRALQTPLRYKSTLLREVLADALRGSPGHGALRRWLEALGLRVAPFALRPSVLEWIVTRPDGYRAAARLVAARRALRAEPRRLQGHPSLAAVLPEEFDPGCIRQAGRLFGYPECCVEAFAADRAAGRSPEERLGRVLAQGAAPEDDAAFFVRGFVPCRPDCPEAAALGRRLLDGLADRDPRLAAIARRLRAEHRSALAAAAEGRAGNADAGPQGGAGPGRPPGPDAVEGDGGA